MNTNLSVSVEYLSVLMFLSFVVSFCVFDLSVFLVSISDLLLYCVQLRPAK